MIKIEKGIEIPPSHPTKSKYPLRTMEIGESFFVKGDSALRMSVRGCCRYASRNTGRAFVTRTVGAGIRVWRTE